MNRFTDLQHAFWHADVHRVQELSSHDPKGFASALNQYLEPLDRKNTLLFFAARVPDRDGHGDAPSPQEAQEPERVELVHLLVNAGADVNARNHRKVTPLHMAARYGLPLVAAALLSHGADPNARDVNQETPLYRAVNLGYDEVARILLDHGANPNLPDRLGQCPLHRAAVKGSLPIVELLLEHGANPRVRDKQGQVPQQVAQGDMGKAIAERMAEHMA
jgi:ankyrin repeat protein